MSDKDCSAPSRAYSPRRGLPSSSTLDGAPAVRERRNPTTSNAAPLRALTPQAIPVTHERLSPRGGFDRSTPKPSTVSHLSRRTNSADTQCRGSVSCPSLASEHASLSSSHEPAQQPSCTRKGPVYSLGRQRQHSSKCQSSVSCDPAAYSTSTSSTTCSGYAPQMLPRRSVSLYDSVTKSEDLLRLLRSRGKPSPGPPPVYSHLHFKSMEVSLFEPPSGGVRSSSPCGTTEPGASLTIVDAPPFSSSMVADRLCKGDDAAREGKCFTTTDEPDHALDAVGLTPVLATTMPKGRYLVMNLLTTWGDAHEIGLCGLELFDHQGVRMIPQAVSGLPQITTAASASSEATVLPGEDAQQEMTLADGVVSLTTGAPDLGLRLLAEYTATRDDLFAAGSSDGLEELRVDPRRQLRNIVSNPLNSHDEGSMFIMPYTPGHDHLICLMFAKPMTLSMIRIFNYSGKGRVHTTKGARIVEMTVDDELVFRGEVAQHSGELVVDEAQLGVTNCENIIFTDDTAVLRRIMEPSRLPQQCFARGHDDHDGGLGSSGATEGAATPMHSRTPTTAAVKTAKTGHISLFLRSPFDTEDNYAGGGSWPVSTSTPSSPAGRAAMRKLRLGRGSSSAIACPSRSNSASTATRALSQRTKGCRGGRVPTHVDGNGLLACQVPRSSASSPKASSSAVSGPVTPARPSARYPACCPREISSVCFMLLATWGDTRQVGLSGLRFRDAMGDLLTCRPLACMVQYPDGSHRLPAEQSALTKELTHLFGHHTDEDCLLPFQRGVQMVFLFEKPIPTLGFLEVANYSRGDRTFCGAKEVRVFCSSGPLVGSESGNVTVEDVSGVYRALWTLGTSAKSRQAVRRHCIFEVTPSEGVSLRKAPALLCQPRYQTYDLSMQGPGAVLHEPSTGASEDSSSRDVGLPELDSFYSIGIGPGTDGWRSDGRGTGDEFGCQTMGGGCFARAASFSNSLNASMNIRAAVAMKRARMMLHDRPDWLLGYQAYITPLLPVGYVCKVRLLLCGRTVRSASSSGEVDAIASPQPPPDSVHSSAKDNLKSYMKEWLLEPLDSCRFVNENGDAIRPIRPGVPIPVNDDGEEDATCVPMVVESIVTPVATDAIHLSATPPGGSARSQGPLQVMVELVYVSDMPFCVSMIHLTRSLVRDGSAAWVKTIQVRMDDALVFDSGDASIGLRKTAPAPAVDVMLDGRPPSGTKGAAPFVTAPPPVDTSPPVAAQLHPCTTTIRPYILFTLNEEVLDRVRTTETRDV